MIYMLCTVLWEKILMLSLGMVMRTACAFDFPVSTNSPGQSSPDYSLHPLFSECYYKNTELLSVEGSSGRHLGQQNRLLRATSTQVLNTFKYRDSKTSLSNLLRCLTTLRRKLFLHCLNRISPVWFASIASFPSPRCW